MKLSKLFFAFLPYPVFGQCLNPGVSEVADCAFTSADPAIMFEYVTEPTGSPVFYSFVTEGIDNGEYLEFRKKFDFAALKRDPYTCLGWAAWGCA